MAKRDLRRRRHYQPSFERLEPRHMLSLSAALTEALGGQPPTIVLPGEESGQPPVLEQPYFPELEPPILHIPTLAEQTESVRLALYGDGFYLVEARDGQRLYTRNGNFHLNSRNELVTQDGLRVLGYQTNDLGEIVPELKPLLVPLERQLSRATTLLEFSGVLNPMMPEGVETPTAFVVYDGHGNRTTLTLATQWFESTGELTVFRWTLRHTPTSQPNDEIASGLITFDPNGDVVAATGLDVGVDGPAMRISFRLSFEEVKCMGEVDALGQPISALTLRSQDGRPPGSLVQFLVLEDGSIVGCFDNGLTATFGQLQVAAIPNPHGLRRVANDFYALTTTSGTPRVGAPNSASLASVVQLLDIYTLTEDGYFLSKDEPKPADASNFLSPAHSRYPWLLRTVNLQLEGPEFFVVEGRDGHLFYTRDGQFRLNAQQELVTLDGYRALGRSSEGAPLGPLVIDFGESASRATDNVVLYGNLSSQQPYARADHHLDARTEFLVYDQFGNPLWVQLETSWQSWSASQNTFVWAAYLRDSGNVEGERTLVGKSSLLFDGQGQLIAGATGQISVTTRNGEFRVINLDFQALRNLPLVNQIGAPYAILEPMSQNGYPPGPLERFSINSAGEILGLYKNGLQLKLGQIQLAQFSKPFWLRLIAPKLLEPTRFSGQPQFVVASDPGVGSITQLPLSQRAENRHDETAPNWHLPLQARDVIETRIKGVFENSESLWKVIGRIFS